MMAGICYKKFTSDPSNPVVHKISESSFTTMRKAWGKQDDFVTKPQHCSLSHQTQTPNIFRWCEWHNSTHVKGAIL